MNVFISGGSRGIGRATVLAFLEQGHDVAFTYRQSQAQAQELVEQARAQFPQRRIQAYALDIRQSQEVERVGELVLSDFQSIQALVCNAGIVINELVVQHSDETWNDVIGTNLTGSFFLCRFFLQHFLENRSGRIVLLSSPNRHGASGLAAYSASKAGLMGLGQSIAKEYGAKGITCNIVSPGYVQTDLTARSGSTKLERFWLESCPAKRSGEANEVAAAILYLCSEPAAFTNGIELPVNGGLNWLL
jgi:3-oxoacyl-[acyl-carrier protein] reductase